MLNLQIIIIVIFNSIVPIVVCDFGISLDMETPMKVGPRVSRCTNGRKAVISCNIEGYLVR